MCITKQNGKVRNIKWAILLILVVCVKLVSLFPYYVENYYSTYLYVFFSCFQRILLGAIPFSLGDICYTVFAIYLVNYMVRICMLLYKRKFTFVQFKKGVLIAGKTVLLLYIIFYLFWGLNYTRLGVSAQFGLKNNKYTDAALKDFLCSVVDELNETRKQLGDSNFVYPSDDSIFQMAKTAYSLSMKNTPFLNHHYQSLKSSLYTPIISYLGYSGYYNPFTGEAQVNIDLPKFYMPYVTCHEMAHQLGYASESEASFIGYLVAKQSKNPLFIYSALFELYITANSELIGRDFLSALLNSKSLNSLVRKDLRTYKSYILRSDNNLEPMVKIAYDHYLKANNQQSGINSYNELVGWVIAYRQNQQIMVNL